MGRPIPVADEAVAESALTRLFQRADSEDGKFLPVEAAELLVETASKIRFQPSTRQLVLTFDLAMGADGADDTWRSDSPKGM